ncbi:MULTISPECIES: ABC transporter ATP-binding protein [unclassified Candidatus Frackibacter]|uniref:ABC transporter ATP-binding protein n=1 Tax=unclassified Candidatus Frackibacter TaxID=2648818 RepID=UPI0008897E66|nr:MULTISPECIES: ABC transporter ATP-binding protein [unclassified Candidatus Frackibacter]SDB99984.1 molybdate transport system ATP-binding protein [Candidatus Frackibacter sp. WG11]SEM31560.1 molybdate transport system ATP-binding protein [Candidatus Frackibacter sp. WG12]SFL36499.1 molybdate transport system ATP-binding protein [Candidatus Frackibacter sp. WG13]
MLKVNVYKKLGDFELDVKFELNNEILVLFGPSGCGKTTTLELIAGLKVPDRGEISNQEVTFFSKLANNSKEDLPINKRRIGYVFQDYSLFPHMTAFENIAYGIQGSIFSEQEIKEKVNELLAELRLKGLADHYPEELSGGQQQRVAIARALIVEPDILLLDEPFSALDTLVREKLRQDLLRIHAEFEIPIIYVTHNLTDVFELADQVAVYNEGTIEQFGTKEEVFYRPQTRNVARFVESKNIFDMSVVTKYDSEIVLNNEKFSIIIPDDSSLKIGEEVIITIRPEFIQIISNDLERRNKNLYAGQIIKILNKGSIVRLFIKVFSKKGFDFIVDFAYDSNFKLAVGDNIDVYLPANKIHIISKN